MDDAKKPLSDDSLEITRDRREIFSSLGLLALGGGAAALLGCENPAEGNGTAQSVPENPEAAVQALGTDLATIAALRALAAPSSGNPSRLVLGHAAANDGGGGVFVWLAFPASPPPPADDDLTIIKPNSYNGNGRWVRLQTVASIAILKSIPTPSGNGRRWYDVLDRATNGDGGGGRFMWNAASTAPDNGGTVIAPNSNPATGRWMRVFSGPIDVRWFGAKADGTNDTGAGAALLAAITSLNGQPGTVAIPGLMVVADPSWVGLYIQGHNGLSLVGTRPGAGLRFLNMPTSPNQVMPGHNYTFAMMFANCANLRITDLQIEDPSAIGGPVFGLVGLVGCIHPTVSGNQFIQTQRLDGARVGVMSAAGRETRVAGNTFRGCCISLQVGASVPPSAQYPDLRDYDVTIEGNTILDSTFDQMQVQAVHAVVANNLLDKPDPMPGAEGSGIVIGGYDVLPPMDMVIVGNHIRRAGNGIHWDIVNSNGAAPEQFNNVVVEGNLIEECLAAGIVLNGGIGVTITGNVIKDCNTGNLTMGGINVGDSGAVSHLTITGNSIFNTSSDPVRQMNYGVRVDSAFSVKIAITGNSFGNINSTATSSGVHMIGARDAHVAANSFIDCSYGLFLMNVSDVNVVGNSIMMNSPGFSAPNLAQKGIRLEGTMSGVSIASNHFRANQRPATSIPVIWVNASGDAAITGNTMVLDGGGVMGGDMEGIFISAVPGASDVTISDNVLRMLNDSMGASFQVGIYVPAASTGTRKVQMFNNVFKGFQTFNLSLSSSGGNVQHLIVNHWADGGTTQVNGYSAVTPGVLLSSVAPTIIP